MAYFLLRNLLAALLFTAGAWLAIQGKEGWGWFLFAGLLIVDATPYHVTKKE